MQIEFTDGTKLNGSVGLTMQYLRMEISKNDVNEYLLFLMDRKNVNPIVWYSGGYKHTYTANWEFMKLSKAKFSDLMEVWYVTDGDVDQKDELIVAEEYLPDGVTT